MFESVKKAGRFSHEVFWAATMPIGAGGFARLTVESVGVTPSDVVVDLGCGPGTAARVAARRQARVIGVDPTPAMLSFARLLTRGDDAERITWREGVAEAIPVADGEATVVIAVRSAHHFDDPTAAFAEIRRVLAPGGRLAIVERALREKPAGHGSHHGLSIAAAKRTGDELAAAGFIQMTIDEKRLRLAKAVVVRAAKP